MRKRYQRRKVDNRQTRVAATRNTALPRTCAAGGGGSIRCACCHISPASRLSACVRERAREKERERVCLRVIYEYEPDVNIRGAQERANPTHKARAHLPLALPRLCLVHSINYFFRLFQIAITSVPERGAARWWQVMTTRGTTCHVERESNVTCNERAT